MNNVSLLSLHFVHRLFLDVWAEIHMWMTQRMHAMGARTSTHARHNVRGAQLNAEIWMNDWLPINGFAVVAVFLLSQNWGILWIIWPLHSYPAYYTESVYGLSKWLRNFNFIAHCLMWQSVWIIAAKKKTQKRQNLQVCEIQLKVCIISGFFCQLNSIQPHSAFLTIPSKSNEKCEYFKWIRMNRSKNRNQSLNQCLF